MRYALRQGSYASCMGKERQSTSRDGVQVQPTNPDVLEFSRWRALSLSALGLVAAAVLLCLSVVSIANASLSSCQAGAQYILAGSTWKMVSSAHSAHKRRPQTAGSDFDDDELIEGFTEPHEPLAATQQQQQSKQERPPLDGNSGKAVGSPRDSRNIHSAGSAKKAGKSDPSSEAASGPTTPRATSGDRDRNRARSPGSRHQDPTKSSKTHQQHKPKDQHSKKGFAVGGGSELNRSKNSHTAGGGQGGNGQEQADDNGDQHRLDDIVIQPSKDTSTLSLDDPSAAHEIAHDGESRHHHHHHHHHPPTLAETDQPASFTWAPGSGRSASSSTFSTESGIGTNPSTSTSPSRRPMSARTPIPNPLLEEEASAYLQRVVFPTLLPAIEKVLKSVKTGEDILDPIGSIAYNIAKQNPNPYAHLPGQRSKYLETVIQRVEDRMALRSATASSRSSFSRQQQQPQQSRPSSAKRGSIVTMSPSALSLAQQSRSGTIAELPM
ncbi:hypothetical protein BC831DRAFT_215760 [Entophlyctis helioformis]|nr:hypothetical protein BC831DRAFT_215760 [Entophlyctis helioformis]